MEAIFKAWQSGSLSATDANEKAKSNGLEFANKIDGGYFEDPISLVKLDTNDKKISSLLIDGNIIFSSETLRQLVVNAPNEDDGDLARNLPSGYPDLSDFISTYSEKLKNPLTRKVISDEDLTLIYKHVLSSTHLTEGDPLNLGRFDRIYDFRTRPAGGGGQAGGSKKKRKTKRRKSIKRRKRNNSRKRNNPRKRSNKLKKTKRRKTRRK